MKTFKGLSIPSVILIFAIFVAREAHFHYRFIQIFFISVKLLNEIHRIRTWIQNKDSILEHLFHLFIIIMVVTSHFYEGRE